MIRSKLKWIPLIISLFFVPACAYIVTPVPDTTPTSEASKGWSGFVNNVETNADGALHIDITILNETTDWSTMFAKPETPATLTSADGKTTSCETVFVSTGDNQLPPGFQIRGYTAGTMTKPEIQMLYVECAGVSSAEGATLSIDYVYTTGEFNYYVVSKENNAKLVLNLGEIKNDMVYPIGFEVPGLIESSENPIEAINKCSLTLTDVQHSDTGFVFSWKNVNPSEYPTYVHIGKPNIIGSDGIIHGKFQSPHLADAPITAAGGEATWETKVDSPFDLSSYYLLMGVESKQQRLFVSHVIDISGK
jgi:hypothetical protein